jgi:hypothetical protein
VGGDFWSTDVDDLIAADNARTLVEDCQHMQTMMGAPECPQLALYRDLLNIDHVRSSFDNLAKVSTEGIDGAITYTLDTKQRGLGDFGTFVVGVQGTYLMSYLIESPRALRPFYREGAPALQAHDPNDPYLAPTFNVQTGKPDYSTLKASYEAAGYRNEENFAPPLPKLRFSVPIRYFLDKHMFGFTVRYIDGYQDDSEFTIEERNLPGIDMIQFAEGEAISSWTVFDASYGFAFGDEGWNVNLAVGVINIADTPPPAVHGPLGYEIGLHDPRGRTVYARIKGEL